MSQEKVIWVVNYNRLEDFLQQCVAVGATSVAIRTDNDLRKAIPIAHQAQLKVYGWRWPSSLHDPAMNEAAKVKALFDQGLDGYFVDPEMSEQDNIDWDRNGLADLAEEFCSTIARAANGKPFGVTSHYLARRAEPKLPWASFFKYATVLLPQAYWRSTEGVIGHGIPADNYAVAIAAWTAAGGDPARIVPMAGELGVSTAAEIAQYVKAAGTAAALHFYAYEPKIRADVWAAVAKA
ncbi:hypothetical protein [Dyella sp. 2RAB6]|uniref:hypothetical protein n=1 Tax=Dyella sp. 2RAB6 TaxID=3232992 RepID=UPI003F91CED1